MFNGVFSQSRIAIIVTAFVFMLISAGAAFAHCDTMDGPVVKDAQAALAKGDVTSVLKWVPKSDEDEIRHAFQKTLAVRAKGPEAKELADMYFFETLIRVHRASEGAPYTGIKPSGTPMPALIGESDEALKNDNVDELAKKIAAAVEAGVRQRFLAAAKAKKHKDHSVEAGREFVAAYVQFVHYVEAIHEITSAPAAHHGHEADAPKESHQPDKPVKTFSRHEHSVKVHRNQ